MKYPVVALALALIWICPSVAIGESILCPTKEYAQYKDIVSSTSPSAYSMDYCQLTRGYAIAQQHGDIREMEQCAKERGKFSDALTAVGHRRLPDCIALDPQRARTALCQLRTKAEYAAMARNADGRSQLKQQFCSGMNAATPKAGKPLDLDELLHCLNAAGAVQEAVKKPKFTSADCQS